MNILIAFAKAAKYFCLFALFIFGTICIALVAG